MTIEFKYEEFRTTSGSLMFIEQYAEKPHFVKFWRYGVVGGAVLSDMLSHKPNKKNLINRY